MAKATIEFTLPEERCKHLAAVHGMDWALVVIKFHERLGEIWRGEMTMPKGMTEDGVELMITMLNTFIENYGLSLEMIE